jgi:hypothetical protein
MIPAMSTLSIQWESKNTFLNSLRSSLPITFNKELLTIIASYTFWLPFTQPLTARKVDAKGNRLGLSAHISNHAIALMLTLSKGPKTVLTLTGRQCAQSSIAIEGAEKEEFGFFCIQSQCLVADAGGKARFYFQEKNVFKKEGWCECVDNVSAFLLGKNACFIAGQAGTVSSIDPNTGKILYTTVLDSPTIAICKYDNATLLAITAHSIFKVIKATGKKNFVKRVKDASAVYVTKQSLFIGQTNAAVKIFDRITLALVTTIGINTGQVTAITSHLNLAVALTPESITFFESESPYTICFRANFSPSSFPVCVAALTTDFLICQTLNQEIFYFPFSRQD